VKKLDKVINNEKFQQQHWIQTRLFFVKSLFAKEISELRNGNFFCTQFSSMLLEFLVVWRQIECRGFFSYEVLKNPL